VLAPRDTTPFYHMVTSWKRALVCRPALGFHDKTYIQGKFNPDIEFPDVMQFMHGRYSFSDRFFGGGFLRQVRGDQNKKYYTALGDWTADFLYELGAQKDHVFVTGNLSYDGVTPRDGDVLSVRKRCFSGVDDRDVYTFFSSQQYFGDVELASLQKIAEGIQSASGVFAVKIHPKLNLEQKHKLISWGQEFFPDTVRIIDDLKGDYYNACLISLSKSVLVEESNVGILAMHFQKPLIVVDLGGKSDSDDNIFRLFDGLLVCDSLDHFHDVLSCLDNSEKFNIILSAQEEFVRYVCISQQAPCGRIVGILKHIL